MIEQSKNKLNDKAEINPYVSNLASKLMQTAANAEMKFDSAGWQLITEVLSFAAAAEQRMSEQQERISFLEQLSVTDELTGIPNRRGLRSALGQTLASAGRHGESGVLGFIDLDGFKHINDVHGHMAGDAVLRYVAKALKQHTRPSDTVARIAGDEFAVILKRCSADQGMKRLRTLQKEINAGKVRYGGATIPVKCSIGVQAFDGTTDPATLIEAADQAMYHDKQARKGAHLKTA
ncbi:MULTISPECIES: GGDEF domain-containing protein [Kordiimonas]|jgi:diguanylate cyclase (GGDEF)-like protein|uniref:diguanylate cyclase n=1 Tax=Kordiimonas lacus TaxID=637679 RepID=A0A1G7C5A0_9PROT|nr:MULTISPECIES: GGDEF domain-containing protein [Kordiimonas]SDE33836.1 diguanylate cyclase (GGDEF) domain-containing protein [Kordiimonas lacus]